MYIPPVHQVYHHVFAATTTGGLVGDWTLGGFVAVLSAYSFISTIPIIRLCVVLITVIHRGRNDRLVYCLFAWSVVVCDRSVSRLRELIRSFRFDSGCLLVVCATVSALREFFEHPGAFVIHGLVLGYDFCEYDISYRVLGRPSFAG